MDSDDYASGSFVENLVTILPGLSQNVLVTLPVKKVKDSHNSTLQDGVNEYSIDSFSIELVRGRKQLGVWSYIFNSHVLKNHGLCFTDGILFEDQYFVPKYLNYVKTIKQVSSKNVGYYYCFRNNSFTNSRLSYKKIMAKYIAESSRNNILLGIVEFDKTKRIINENFIDIYFRAYIDLLRIGQLSEAKKKRAEAIKITNSMKYVAYFKTRVKTFLLKVPLSTFGKIMKFRTWEK